MIYVTISDHALQVVQTKKSIFGKEQITATNHKELEEGVINGGVVEKKDLFVSFLNELLVSAYPKAMKDSSLSLSISDRSIELHRFTLGLTQQKVDLNTQIINKAKELVLDDLSSYENLYKIIEKPAEEKNILFTSLPHSILNHYYGLFQSLGYEIRCISTHSFCWFYLLSGQMQANDIDLYINIEKKLTEFFVLDKNGPILIVQTGQKDKTKSDDLSTQVKKILDDHKLKISKIVLGGVGSLEVSADELANSIHIPTVKLNEKIDGIYDDKKISFVTNGESKSVYACCVGLMSLASQSSGTNFVKDYKIPDAKLNFGKDASGQIQNIKKEEVKMDGKKEEMDKNEENKIVEQPKETETKISGKESEEINETQKQDQPIEKNVEKNSATESGLPDSQLATQPIIEYKKTIIQQIMEKKIIIGIILMVIVVLVISGIGFSSVNHGSFPFQSPSPTPSTLPPTPTPTITPVPTIDVKLKRSDIKLSVQNGTEKTGFAKEIGDYLEIKGYRNVLKENADTNTYDATQLKMKESKKNFFSLIASDLKSKFEIVGYTSLDASSSADAVLVLGKK